MLAVPAMDVTLSRISLAFDHDILNQDYVPARNALCLLEERRSVMCCVMKYRVEKDRIRPFISLAR